MSAAVEPALDPRLDPPTWDAARTANPRLVSLLLLLNVALAVWYFAWLLEPARIGNPILYGLLVAAETFNLVQAAGFWWTSRRQQPRPRPPAVELPTLDVDVFIPVYHEPVHVVEPTVAAATRLRGARVQVHLLDDGKDPAKASLAERHGARYHTRAGNRGAKAGNINTALRRTSAPLVVVLDCDHVPSPDLLTHTLGYFRDGRLAFVQTPQYYANHVAGGVPAAAWAQQALFFGGIARGKDRLGAMFCCGTNVVFRRAALEAASGFPEHSVTEDFVLSIRLHEKGWRSAYHPEVLAAGLGPEDLSSYVTQQLRWSRGCLGAVWSTLTARLHWRHRLQYLLSAMYFLSGWTLAIYMSLPLVRIVTGQQPLARLTADQFLLHFAPYFIGSITTVSLSGAGAYTFAGFALAASGYWVHMLSTLRTLLRRRGGFVVTSKGQARAWQPTAAAPALVTLLLLLGIACYGLVRAHTPAMLNNVAFALLHVGVLWAGIRAALIPRSAAPEPDRAATTTPAAAAPSPTGPR